jgi:aryl sulfotransferase
VTTAARYRSLVADNARWDGFQFRDDDIIISTPPKCGTTWTQMICGLLIFGTPDFDRPLDLISPWLEQTVRPLEAVVADLEAQTHRRFIKSHTPLDGLPFDERVTYITVGRDPRDVAISMAHHFDNMDFEAFLSLIDGAVGLQTMADVMPTEMAEVPTSTRERFWQWADDTTMPGQSVSGLRSTIHHLETFWDARHRPNVVLLHYNDLCADLEREIRRLAERLGLDAADAGRLAEAASFDAMRRRAKDVAPNSTETIWLDANAFFHSGTTGQWQDVLDAADLQRYAIRTAEMGPADFLDWVHRGRLTV